MSPLHIVADENIPFVREAFEGLGTVRLVPGQNLKPAAVRAADVLLVRSVTPVNESLLAGSRVRFVGSATIGMDHVDTAYLQRRGIAFAHAPGSNADSVVEYVLAALLCLSVRRGRPLRGRTVGIVGCGNIGGRLARRLPALGVRLLLNDPPLAEAAERRGEAHPFVPLEALLAAADLVTLHVPLLRAGPHATHHLIGAEELRRMQPGAWLVNTCRGAVVSNDALKAALERGHLGAAVLDVWEGEPAPDPGLLQQVELATPHIAGYSYDGKVQGMLMLYKALMTTLGRSLVWDCESVLRPGAGDLVRLTPPAVGLAEPEWLWQVVRQMYDIEADDERMRRLLTLTFEQQGAYFSALRKQYPRRRTFARHRVARHAVPGAYRRAVRAGLGVSWEVGAEPGA